MASSNERLILASASSARAALLRAAGAEFAIRPADLDETIIKQRVRREGGSAAQCAAALALAKAQAVSAVCPGALVIGADQILTTGDEWFDKPENAAAAAAQLRRLRGRKHWLATAVCVVCDGARLWDAEAAPELTMREFSDSFLDTYLAEEGGSVLGSVGSYRLEGRGVQLFERIVGDYFAILGLPLIGLLGFLRGQGVLPQ
jgi:septum formation protein